jgi:hypothetical protein
LDYWSSDSLSINCAGLICKDVSRESKTRRGDAGNSALAHLIWTAERRSENGQEDLVLVECTVDFDASSIAADLGQRYDVYQTTVNATDMGDKYSRPRAMAPMLNQERVVTSDVC